MEDQSPIWTVTAKIFNKQFWTADRWWSSRRGMGMAYVSRGENLLAASTPVMVIRRNLTGKLTMADYMCNLVTNIMN
jgi:hypothetical protein